MTISPARTSTGRRHSRELRQRLLVGPGEERDAGQELVLRADSRLNAHVVLPQRFTSVLAALLGVRDEAFGQRLHAP